MPALRAAGKPRLGCEIRRTRGSVRRVTTSTVPSVQPSSTTTTSSSRSVCPSADFTAEAIVRAELNAGITTENIGAEPAVDVMQSLYDSVP